MNLRNILRRIFRRRAHPTAHLRIAGHSRPAAEAEIFDLRQPRLSAGAPFPHIDPKAHRFISDDDGAAFIAGQEAAKLVFPTHWDRGHERAWWAGYLSGLRRKVNPLDLARFHEVLGGPADGR